MQASEWDFSGCPVEQLRNCLQYELSREIPAFKAGLVQILNSEKSGLNFNSGISSILSSAPSFTYSEFLFMRNPHLDFLNTFKEWPEKPWMKLDKGLREQAGKHEDMPWLILFSDGKKLLNGNCIQPNVFLEEEGKQVAYAALKLDWSLSDQKLLESFHDYLRYWRPKDSKAIETRGKRRRYQEVLKWLSAKRLLDHMSWKDAANLAQKHTENELYKNQSAWLRARKQAEWAIATFEKAKNLEAVLEGEITG